MNYWELFTQQNDFIFRHVQQDQIQHNVRQGIKYTWYPVYACPIVTDDPEHMIACITDVVVAENGTESDVIYSFFLLSPSEENHRNTDLLLKHVTANGIMGPERAIPYADLIGDMFPDQISWLFVSPVPVLDGQRNHELDQQKKQNT